MQQQPASALRGSATPVAGDDSFVNGGQGLETGRISPAGGQQLLGQSMGKETNMSMISKDYIDADKKILRVLSQRYELREELGKGAHGRIYSGRDKISKQLIAVKVMEKLSKNKSKFVREISLMKDMQKYGQPGFPRLLYHSSDKNQYYIVMDLLQSSLKDLRDSQEDKKFSIKSVTMIALQILQRLESIHKFGYVHRDLKPANMMVGKSTKGDLNIIYLIDFGLTKKQNQVSNLPHQDNTNKVVGTAVYAGINAHLPSANYYKKDDLESLMYVLCYLGTGNLPWKNFKATEMGLEKMMKYKIKISPFDLFAEMPIEYAQVLDYIKNLSSDQNIDYQYIETLFKQVAQNNKIKLDNRFDWMQFQQSQTINYQPNHSGQKSPSGIGLTPPNNNFLTVNKPINNHADYNQSEGFGNQASHHVGLGGFTSNLNPNMPQSANLNSGFVDSGMYPNYRGGEPAGLNEGQSTNYYGAQLNAQNNMLTSLKIDFHSKVEGSGAIDLLQKKLTQKNKQTTQQNQASAAKLLEDAGKNSIKLLAKPTNLEFIPGINLNEQAEVGIHGQIPQDAKQILKVEDIDAINIQQAIKDPSKIIIKKQVSPSGSKKKRLLSPIGGNQITSPISGQQIDLRPLGVGLVGKDQNANRTADVVFSAAVEDVDGQLRSISPDLNQSQLIGKKKKGKKSKKGNSKKVNTTLNQDMIFSQELQVQGPVRKDDDLAQDEKISYPIQQQVQQFPKFDGKYDINLTVNIMQNNSNDNPGALSVIPEQSKSNADGSSREDKKSGSSGAGVASQNLVKCPPDQQVSFAPVQNQHNQNPNIVQIVLVNVSSMGSAQQQNDASGRIQNFQVQINSSNQACEIGKIQSNSNSALVQKVLEDHKNQLQSLKQLKIDQIEDVKIEEPNSPTFEEFEKGILSERCLYQFAQPPLEISPAPENLSIGIQQNGLNKSTLNQPTFFSPRKFFTHSNSDRMRNKSFTIIQ